MNHWIEADFDGAKNFAKSVFFVASLALASGHFKHTGSDFDVDWAFKDIQMDGFQVFAPNEAVRKAMDKNDPNVTARQATGWNGYVREGRPGALDASSFILTIKGTPYDASETLRRFARGQ